MNFCREGRMVTVCLSDESYQLVIDILQEKFYETTDLDVLSKINQVYKEMGIEVDNLLGK